MSNELVVLDADDIIRSGLSGFNEKDLPQVIQGQISKLNELDKSVKKAMEAAASAKDSAISAKNMSAGFGKKKVAIEELQSAGIDLAEAVQSGAEAQKISFEFQTKLAEISKYLFGLGVSNIASNRFVVRELEMRLKGASREELSETARQELISVVKQLKEQEDLLIKLENLSETIKNHDETLKFQLQENQYIDEQLQAHAEIYLQHSEQLNIHAESSERLEVQLKAQAELDKQHIGQLKILAENFEYHEGQLGNLHENNDDLNEQIKNNLKTIEAQEIRINSLNDEVVNLKTLLDSKANNILLKITMPIAIIAFVLSLIHFFY